MVSVHFPTLGPRTTSEDTRGGEETDNGSTTTEDNGSLATRQLTRYATSETQPVWGWDFNIDRILDPIIPPSPIHHLPPMVSRFLGYRTKPDRPVGSLVVVAWTFIGVLAGVLLVEAVDAHIAAFRVDGKAYTIGSFGASAVLQFYAIESPLAQPRNAVLGKLLSSIVGVSISKLFSLAGPATFEHVRWVAGALACAAATALMALTGTVHPPAGATALIAVMDDHMYALGWMLVPAVLLGALLMQAVALVLDNIQRRFPIYWWSPEETGTFWKRKWREHERRMRRRRQRQQHNEKGGEGGGGGGGGGGVDGGPSDEAGPHQPANNTQEDEDDRGDYTPDEDNEYDDGASLRAVFSRDNRIVITPNGVLIPETLPLRPDEKLLLEGLSKRL